MVEEHHWYRAAKPHELHPAANQDIPAQAYEIPALGAGVAEEIQSAYEMLSSQSRDGTGYGDPEFRADFLAERAENISVQDVPWELDELWDAFYASMPDTSDKQVFKKVPGQRGEGNRPTEVAIQYGFGRDMAGHSTGKGYVEEAWIRDPSDHPAQEL